MRCCEAFWTARTSMAQLHHERRGARVAAGQLGHRRHGHGAEDACHIQRKQHHALQVVIQTHYELALHSPQEGRYAREVVLAEQPLAVVLLAVPIGWVHVEERAWLVKALDHLVVGFVLDEHASQAQMGLAQAQHDLVRPGHVLE